MASTGEFTVCRDAEIKKRIESFRSDAKDVIVKKAYSDLGSACRNL